MQLTTLPGTAVSALKVRVHPNIESIGRKAWAQLAADPLEGYDYYSAIEASALPGIEPMYFVVSTGQDIVAVAAGYRHRLDIASQLQGPLARLLRAVRSMLPRLCQPRVMVLGSPVTEHCNIVCAPHWQDRAPALMNALITALRHQAREEGMALTLVKDVPEELPALHEVLRRHGYLRVAGMPRTLLALPYKDLDGYLGSLGRVTRKSLRRKLREVSDLRIEARQHQVADVIEQMLELYADTVVRSGQEIEVLTAEYFQRVLRHMGERATCYLFWSGSTLIGFNLLLHDKQRMIDKVFASDGSAARRHNLYHRTWLAHVSRCIELGIPAFEASQAAYAEKLRLGCRLLGNDHYLRHRSTTITRLLGWLASRAGVGQPAMGDKGEQHEP